jgi:hypothetical protein
MPPSITGTGNTGTFLQGPPTFLVLAQSPADIADKHETRHIRHARRMPPLRIRKNLGMAGAVTFGSFFAPIGSERGKRKLNQQCSDNREIRPKHSGACSEHAHFFRAVENDE